ncbi:MAG: RNA-binding protein [Planctomycetota bacterium]|nr:RNA-binding protein [Planctomycetota bacterium]MDA1212764.1 RNA-binding protein [Planctomycetota bacterium]
MTNIFVGNLSYQATERDLRNVFERFGRVGSIRLMTDRATGRSRGFAFVNMQCLDDADEAIHSLNGSPLCGRPITVNEANKDDEDGPNANQPSESFKQAVAFLDSL